jgi:hypothetical protein
MKNLHLLMRKHIFLVLLLCFQCFFCSGQDRGVDNSGKDRWSNQTSNDRWATSPVQQRENRQTVDRQVIDRETIYRQTIEREIVDRETIERTIYYQFGEYVDNVYVISLQTQDYINAHITVDQRHQINIGKIMGNIAVGEGVMFVAAVALSMVPGAQPFSAFIILWHTKALAGAAAGAAISGVVEYISSGGDIESTFNRALEGASDGYKWAAVLAVGEDVIKTARIARATAKSKAAVTNFSTAYRNDFTNIIGQYSDDIARSQPPDIIDAFKQYSAAADQSTFAGYQRINAYLDGRLPASALSNAERTEIQRVIRSMDSVLTSSRTVLPNDLIVHKGMNLSREALGDIIGVRIVPGAHGEITTNTLKNAIGTGKEFLFKSYASTSLDLTTAMQFAKDGNNIPCLFRIIAPRGTHAIGMTRALSVNPHEAEILLAHGQRWICTGVEMRNGIVELAITIKP